VGNSLLAYAEISGEDHQHLQKGSAEMERWEQAKGKLRMATYGVSVLQAVITVIGMTSLFAGDQGRMDQIQQKVSFAAVSLSVVGGAISVYDNREKIYRVAKVLFEKAYGLFPAGLADTLSKVSKVVDSYFTIPDYVE